MVCRKKSTTKLQHGRGSRQRHKGSKCLAVAGCSGRGPLSRAFTAWSCLQVGMGQTREQRSQQGQQGLGSALACACAVTSRARYLAAERLQQASPNQASNAYRRQWRMSGR